LAYHYTEAGLNEQAVIHWYQAGQQAVERSANREALTHLGKVLEVLKVLPDGLERSQRELGCLMLIGLALMATKGQASEEVEDSYYCLGRTESPPCDRRPAECQHISR
jgi:hypothetical protein